MEKKYDPIGCQHKHYNGFSSWSFQSESSGSGPETDYHVSILVCQLCGEIRITGRRWDGKSKHVDHFCEEFNIYHPFAIDAIIKQANFFNEDEIWGRLPSAVEGPVWVSPLVKQPENFPDDWFMKHWRYASDHYKLDTDLFEVKDGGLCKKGGTGKLEWHEIEWLYETETTDQSGSEE